MGDERSFLSLIHYTGKIKKNSRVGIRFSSKEPISVFLHSSTTRVELQNTILQKLGCDADLELYAKLEDVVASSGGSNPNPTSVHIGGSSSSAPVVPVVLVIPRSVASPSFAADLHHEDDDRCDLGDNCTFSELVTTVDNNPHNVFRGVQISDPEGVEGALCDDEKDKELEFIGGDSDDDHPSIPVVKRGGPSSSGSHTSMPDTFSCLGPGSLGTITGRE
ncbi:hypothetical protein PIB30_088124 [Stylosanthes scabra]|uniref:Uncharacterized protein n=1 Tax=Stylosanthes scabra TaxID=79078 RepID=A0ABU6VTE6_9FABA|nr:hypothetical protein [Stylosanthes scabra]